MKALLALAALLALTLIGLEPCPTEDSTFCYWDGTNRGNGTGISYIAITERVAITY